MNKLQGAIRSTITYRSKQQNESEEVQVKIAELLSNAYPEVYVNLVIQFKKVTPGYAAYYLKEAK